MKRVKYAQLLFCLITIIPGAKLSAHPTETNTDNRLAQTQAELSKTSEAYQASLAALLPLDEEQTKLAAQLLATHQQLFAEGIISKQELEQSERVLSAAQAKLDETQQKLAEAAPKTIAPTAEKALVKGVIRRVKTARPAAPSKVVKIVRYNTAANWSLADLGKVESFFTARFGRLLPKSAVGQTAIHNKLRFDHSQAADVAVHPDSAEGRELIAYLQQEGIPFIAIRGAIRGSATGPHIHIGKPSRKTT